MRRLLLALGLALVLVVGHGEHAQADTQGPCTATREDVISLVAERPNALTVDQERVVGLIYRYAEFYGLRDVDLDTMLRVARRESQYGVGMVGDHGSSIGVFQFNDKGVWLSTPFQQEYGLAGRWNNEANVAAAMWAVNQGLISHWRPWEHDANWSAPVPSKPSFMCSK